jgi:cation diffusion facilitator family transporter
MDDKKYYSTVKRVLIIVLALNIVVTLAKGLYGWYTNSLSMISDSIHSFFDSTSNIIGIVGIIIASRPPDIRHPYGHSKYETFASIGVAVLLFITCFEIFQSAIGRFLNPTTPEINIISFLIMGITIAINIGVSVYENRKGHEIKSNILIADSLHTRSDIYVSLAVVLGFFVIQLGYAIADPIIAVIIAILIAKMGIEIIKESSGVLLDKTVVDEEIIKKIVNSNRGVEDSHKIRTRGSASHIYVDLHIILDSCYSLDDAHTIAHEVENSLKTRIPEIKDVVVHLDPCKNQNQEKRTNN